MILFSLSPFAMGLLHRLQWHSRLVGRRQFEYRNRFSGHFFLLTMSVRGRSSIFMSKKVEGGHTGKKGQVPDYSPLPGNKTFGAIRSAAGGS